MAGKQLVVESLERLIKEVEMYRVELDKNRAILDNAANVCDVAMGSDDIVKKHVDNLRTALRDLDNTSLLASEVAAELRRDLQSAEDIERNI